MSSPPPSRSFSRRYIALIALVVVAAGGWGLFWAIGQNVFANVADNVRDIARSEGGDVSCGNEVIGGFPFRFELSCTPLRVEDPKHGMVSIAGFRAVALAYNPTHLIFEADAPLAVENYGSLSLAGASTTADWLTARASARVAGSGLMQFDASVEAPSIVLAALGIDAVRATSGQVHLRRSPERTQGIDAAVTLKQIALPNGAPSVDLDVLLTLSHAAPLLAGAVPTRLQDLVRAGLLAPPDGIVIERLRIASRGTVLAADGRLGIDEAGRLSGVLPITIAGAERLTEALAPFFPPGSNVPKLLQGAVTGLGRPATLDGQDAATVTVSFDRGKAQVGILPLGMVPTLY